MNKARGESLRAMFLLMLLGTFLYGGHSFVVRYGFARGRLRFLSDAVRKNNLVVWQWVALYFAKIRAMKWYSNKKAELQAASLETGMGEALLPWRRGAGLGPCAYWSMCTLPASDMATENKLHFWNQIATTVSKNVAKPIVAPDSRIKIPDSDSRFHIAYRKFHADDP